MHIISIMVKSRVKEIPDVQKILTEYGENIVSRLGLHNIGENKNGLIIIVYSGEHVEDFINKLNKIENVFISNMEIQENL